ncbi:MAG: FKBP-type peptidyl-prolyl cis-trans isomerase [Bacteroidia bacterium]|nr:FKBP-type peptidyl-prolyl cis-trans isomerase [Bacteroidia bacterium]
MKYLSLILALGFMLFTGCDNQFEEDKLVILEYIEDNNLEMQVTEEGIYYAIERTGSGIKPDLGSTVTVHYEGKLLDGTIFDSSYQRGEKARFPLTGVIEGWQIAIPLLQEGGKGKFIIPSEYAYGRSGTNGIPGNSVLVFDVELFSVE